MSRDFLSGFEPHSTWRRGLQHAAACNFGIRQRLNAAAVKVNNHHSLSRPRNFTFRNGPTDFIQPKGFSTQ